MNLSGCQSAPMAPLTIWPLPNINHTTHSFIGNVQSQILSFFSELPSSKCYFFEYLNFKTTKIFHFHKRRCSICVLSLFLNVLTHSKCVLLYLRICNIVFEYMMRSQLPSNQCLCTLSMLKAVVTFLSLVWNQLNLNNSNMYFKCKIKLEFKMVHTVDSKLL